MKLRRFKTSKGLSQCADVYALLGVVAVNFGCSSAGGLSAEQLASAEEPPAFGGQSGDEGVIVPPPTPPAVPGTPPPTQVPNPEAVAVPPPPAADLDVTDFEFHGQPIAAFLSQFGGTRPAHWLGMLDESSPSLLIPSPGPTEVGLTVTGEPTSIRKVIRADGVESFVLTVPMRLQTSDGRLDTPFTGEMGLLESGQAWVWHDFTTEEVGALVSVLPPPGVVGKVRYSLSANLWPGGSAGSLTASILTGVAQTSESASSTYTLHDNPPPPPSPPPVASPVIEPPAGWPDSWKLEQTPGSILAWPNGKTCAGASGRDYALAGLTPATLLDLLSHVEGLTLTQGRSNDPGTPLTLEAMTAEEDVCVSTKAWRGSSLNRLAVTADMHVRHEASGLDLTLPVEIAALHDEGEVETVYFASSVEWWSWAPSTGTPMISGANVEARTGLPVTSGAYAIFPLLTGKVEPASMNATGQILLAAPTRDIDGSTASVTDLNLGGAMPSEVQMLFSGGDWTGVGEVLFDGVWNEGGREP